jgi:hypothetical protein
MANVLTTNPIFLDTAGVVHTATCSPKAVAWVSDQASNCDIAADDDFLISDANGGRIIGKRAEEAGDGFDMVFFPPNYTCEGLTLTTIDGGVCYLYF